jgi:hypothetical protein
VPARDVATVLLAAIVGGQTMIVDLRLPIDAAAAAALFGRALGR